MGTRSNNRSRHLKSTLRSRIADLTARKKGSGSEFFEVTYGSPWRWFAPEDDSQMTRVRIGSNPGNQVERDRVDCSDVGSS